MSTEGSAPGASPSNESEESRPGSAGTSVGGGTYVSIRTTYGLLVRHRGWDPFYSSWWWGGPSVYVVTGGDGEGDGSGPAAEEEAPPAPRVVPQRAPRDDG